MTERYWIRPTRPDAVAWTNPPEWIARLMAALGYTEVDAACFRIHIKTRWRA
ncbi:MAG: hypothetical protein GWN53_17070 [Gammaproteobacteria bacterium]|uniref:Uncharacterized protein n=1 Tax=Candidatus Kutchimonas denitrificans TaxID=3056748 RepID=A0AAE5CC66_9BACT|nr:hypothetical protein [Candidatus Kutchimonas denitrificans]NIV53553.1 hypothetical protein [Gammaproteobacteria bacterium]